MGRGRERSRSWVRGELGIGMELGEKAELGVELG